MLPDWQFAGDWITQTHEERTLDDPAPNADFALTPRVGHNWVRPGYCAPWLDGGPPDVLHDAP